MNLTRWLGDYKGFALKPWKFEFKLFMNKINDILLKPKDWVDLTIVGQFLPFWSSKRDDI